VIGGAGYVGCVLVEELLAKGYSVRVLDRLFFGREPIAPLLDRIELVVEDMREFDESHVEDCGAMINIGGLSNDPTAEFNPRANHEMNTEASIRAAAVAKRAGIPRLIFGSTASIYDRGVGRNASDELMDERRDVHPTAAYASSKFEAEQGILRMADADFAPVSFRQGTVFGFSPRMRYDLVVNTFVKDALSTGRMTLFYGGAMWRPLIDVRDVARAYVTALEADLDAIRGQIFNLAAENFRVSELALQVRQALAAAGVETELSVDLEPRMVRSYRMSTQKVERELGFEAGSTVEDSVRRMVREIRRRSYTDFSHPRYYNIEWMKLLEETVAVVSRHGYVLSKPAHTPAVAGDVITPLPIQRRPAG
jgi:nucleoside-diphosphate-sugar epimerase